MDVRDHCIAVHGIRLRVREWLPAEPSDVLPIVLVHGLASNSRIWDAVAPRLARRFHVVALDQRGHGLSDKPSDGYDFSDVAGDLRGAIDALDLDRPTLVGHSWGGNVVVSYAATYPDDVRSLVLVDGGFLDLSSRPGFTWERVRVDLAPPDLTHLTFPELRERARSGHASAYWSPAVEATLRTSFEDGPDGHIRPRLSRENHLQILRAMWEQHPAALFPRIPCPVLILPARRSPDDVSPEHAARERERAAERERLVERAAALFPDARVHWFENTVHDVPLQRPAELAELIAGTTLVAP
ncbi:MAG: alpha/beta hydrolase [Chloroflexi bacterium]|nr:alpha/beta hydrolase [Chloroflexota bacterium]